MALNHLSSYTTVLKQPVFKKAEKIGRRKCKNDKNVRRLEHYKEKNNDDA